MKTSAGILQGANYDFTMQIPPFYHESLIHEAIANYNSNAGGDILTQYFSDRYLQAWLYETHQQEPQELMVRVASTATVALFNLEGSALLHTRGRGALDIQPDSYQLLLLQPSTHRLELSEGRHRFLFVFLSPSVQSLVSEDAITEPHEQPPMGRLSHVSRELIMGLYQRELEGDIWLLKRQVLLLDLLFRTLDESGVSYRREETAVYHRDFEKLASIKSYIAENIDKKLSLQHLSTRFGIQPTQLRRGYYKVFHQHLCDYIRDLRLDKARRLLRKTGLPVQEIAWEVGYESAAGFSRMFAHYYNRPPMDIRKN